MCSAASSKGTAETQLCPLPPTVKRCSLFDINSSNEENLFSCEVDILELLDINFILYCNFRYHFFKSVKIAWVPGSRFT